MTEPKIKPLLKIPKSELNTAALGKVVIGPLSVGAMLQVSKLLTPEAEVTDGQIARTLFRAVAKIPHGEENGNERSLNSEELASITDADIENFAVLFNGQEGWTVDPGGPNAASSPVQLLCQKVRDELKRFGESVGSAFTLSKDLFSEDTRRLLSESVLIGERLKEFAGVSKLADQLEFSRSSALKEAMDSFNRAAVRPAARLAEEYQRLVDSSGKLSAIADRLKTARWRIAPEP